MDYFLELFLGGLTRGSIYALIALGYTMVYGIIELINFAHGEIYMIGAFTALIVASALTVFGFNSLSILVLASLAAVIWSSAYGFTIEKLAYKPLRKAQRLSRGGLRVTPPDSPRADAALRTPMAISPR